jgi:AmmeMemoRadiSam system protein A
VSAQSPIADAARSKPSGDQRGAELLRWARESLREALGGRVATAPSAPWAQEQGATFVSFHWPDGGLQGCIGSLEPHQSIVDDVARNAVAAGLRDPRGRWLELVDVDQLDVDVSILSPLEPLVAATEAGAKALVRPGIDGLLIEARGRRGTLLPVVWESLPEVDDFFHALKQKARLPLDYWGDDVRLWRYTVELHRDPARGVGA